MTQPDLKTIAHKLEAAAPIEMAITPLRAFFLVSLLHLATRHPMLETESPHVYEVAISMIKNLTAKLGEIDPTIATSLNLGWDESMDMTKADFEQFHKTDDLPQRNYSQLRPDIQQEVIVNSIALSNAVEALSQYLGGSEEQWTKALGDRANAAVDQMSPEFIKKEIAQIDFMRDFGGRPPV